MNSEDEIRILGDLIACATVSDRSNLDIVSYIENYLYAHSAAVWTLPSVDGRKANLLARLGPDAAGGLLLSGHTDVVPVEGQAWSTPPFELTRKEGRLFGRGAADMKGFIAAALSCVPEIAGQTLRKPVYLALSYDEELGCLGVHELIAHLKAMSIEPDLCVVGEPTGMEVGLAHKGNRTYRLTFAGQAAHSSRAPAAVNAVAYAAEFVSSVTQAAAAFAREGPFDPGFDVPHSTVHVGVMNGGSQVNIVPDRCVVDMEFRYLPGADADCLTERLVLAPANQLNSLMSARDASCGVAVEKVYSYPAFDMPPDHPNVALAKRSADRNGDVKLSFGTEAGCFVRGMDVPVVVCGPGDIRQAHQPDEYIEVGQLGLCRDFLLKLTNAMCS